MKGFVLFLVFLDFPANFVFNLKLDLSQHGDKIKINCSVNGTEVESIERILVKQLNKTENKYISIGEIMPNKNATTPNENYEVAGVINNTALQHSYLAVSMPLDDIAESTSTLYTCFLSYINKMSSPQTADEDGVVFWTCINSGVASSSAAILHITNFSWSILSITLLFILG